MAIANIETILTPEEQDQIPPSIFGKYFEEGIDIGIEKGIDIGIEKGTLRAIQRYIKKNPTATDQSVADLFEVDVDLVHKARHSDSL